VPEREAVAAAGGRVAIAGDPKDHSTKDMIATILSRFGSPSGSGNS
jgi:D-glycero-beta-D-manno-heptose 1-phosphate adenylyltransferase